MFGIFKGAKEEAQQAKQAQVELAEAFEAVGVNLPAGGIATSTKAYFGADRLNEI